MEHDPSFDRLLRQTLRDDGAPAGACLDAETLAAWSDGTLSHAERQAAERHVADCVRCLATLAAMDTAAASAVPPSSAVSTRPRWFSVRWLAPAAAAMAAVVLWIAVDRQFTAPPLEQKSAAVQPPETPATAQSAPPPHEADAVTPRAFGGKTAGDSTAVRQAEKEVAGRNERARADRPDDALLPKPDARGLPYPSAEAAASPRIPVPPPAAAPQRAEAAPEAARAAADEPRTRPAAPLPFDDKPREVVVTAPPTVLQESVTAVAASQPAGRAGVADRSAFANVTIVATPDPAIRWRFTGRIIERSIDSGATWQPRTVSVPGPVVAGSCPSATLCWFVGIRGTIVTTGDGEKWRVVVPPVANINIANVAAVDALSATIRAVDGRSFRTSDGGATWVAQENPPAPFSK